jgi:hypothetical protein
MDLFGGAMIAVALGAMALLWRSLNPPPPLEISERGILDRRLRLGWIPWAEIEGAYLPGPGDRDCLRIRLNAGPRLARRLRRRRASVAADPAEVLVDLAGTQMSAVGVLQQIVAHGERSGAAG